MTTEIVTTGLRIKGEGERARLQQKVEIVEGTKTRYEWRDVEVVPEDDGGQPVADAVGDEPHESGGEEQKGSES